MIIVKCMPLVAHVVEIHMTKWQYPTLLYRVVAVK